MNTELINNTELNDILESFYIENKNKGLYDKTHIFNNYKQVKKPLLWYPSGIGKLIDWINPYIGLTVQPNVKKIIDGIYFGTESGIFFSSDLGSIVFYYFEIKTNLINGIVMSYLMKFDGVEDFLNIEGVFCQKYESINYYYLSLKSENSLFNLSEKPCSENELNLILDLQNRIKNIIHNNESLKQSKLEVLQNSFLNTLDKDGNGEVDLVDGESFNKLLNKNQNIIINVDKNFIQKFVKISMYLKTKKSNTQKIFDSIKDTKNDTELNELINLLKNQIHTYELLVFHSISMITSLVESDLITFYEIYECFDQFGVFNSNWENEVSNKLSDIGDGIKELMYSIYKMENNIVNSIDNLTYTTQESFKDLTNSVEKQLSSIDSSIKFNNLITGIQTYQMYKINQNTKIIG
jgi:hypothetical protein